MILENYPHPVIRLTSNEMNQLLEKNVDDIFYHINLQHSGISYIDFAYINYLAALIKTGGKNSDARKIDPILNLKKLVLLELLDIKFSIPIRNLVGKRLYTIDSEENPSFLLENSLGLIESICDKYCKVRDISREDVLNMMCFIRKFRVVEFRGE